MHFSTVLNRRLAACTYAFLLTASSALSQVDVLTQHNDNSRTGANLKEMVLNKANVKNGQFGKLAFRQVDGNPYAQPLIVTAAKIEGRGTKNVVIVATERNSVYAFDADDVSQPSTAAQLWHTDASALGKSIEYIDLYSTPKIKAPQCVDITVDIGISSTPAIQLTKQDSPREGVVYVAAKSKEPDGTFVYSLFALSLTTGKVIGKVAIAGEVSGSGSGSVLSNGKRVMRFDPVLELNRPGLLLSDNKLYVAFSGHCDAGAYHGWMFVYDVSNPAQPKRVGLFCVTPNGKGLHEGRAGIWMSGSGPAVDADGFVYVATGDGTYNGQTDFGDSAVKLKLTGAKLAPEDWFTPQNQEFLKANDVDLGSGGIVLLPNSHLLLAGGKEGRLFLVDRDHMGKGTATSLHSLVATRPQDGDHFYNIHGTPVVWARSSEMFIYYTGEESPVNQYRLVPDTGAGGNGWKFNPVDSPFKSSEDCAQKPNCISAPFPNFPRGEFGQANREDVWMPGGFMSISANGENDDTGILWIAMPFDDNANHRVVRGVLRALDASDVTKPELWDSEGTGDDNDRLGQFAKFCPPTVANGKVYVSTFRQEVTLPGGNRIGANPPADQASLAIYGLKGAH